MDVEKLRDRARERMRAWRALHKDDPAFKERQRQYAAKQRTLYPEKVKARNRAYYKKNAKRLLAKKSRKWYANVELSRAQARAYHQSPKRKAWRAVYDKREDVCRRRRELEASPEQREKRRKRNSEFRKKNPGRLYELYKSWIKRNPELLAAHQARRYARKRGAYGSHNYAEWLSLCNQHDGRCAYCGAKAKLTRDHIVPLSKGGSDYISNILPACRSCNSAKRDRDMTVAELREALSHV